MEKIDLSKLLQVKKEGDKIYSYNSKDSIVAGLPLGYIYTWPFSTPPEGSIIANGSEYSRELYSDLWNYISSHSDWIKTEEEWQNIASSSNGYCPYYSSGDGTTTFRTPKFAPFQQLAISSSNAGLYHEAGLPNITGRILNVSKMNAADSGYSESSGVFRAAPGGYMKDSTETTPGSRYWIEEEVLFAANMSNSIYGNSSTVCPESHDWIVCVVAFGTISNVGNTDVANVMSAVSQVQSNPNLQGAAYIVETWIGDKQSYIKYSNGVADIFMQSATSEAGVVVTLPIEIFEHYSISVTPTLSGTAVTSQVTELSSSTTVGVFISRLDNYQGVACGFTLRVCGRWK